MLEADEILSDGFATMGPILNGVMAVHRSTIDHARDWVHSSTTPETGWISPRGAMMFSHSVMTALAPGLECCGPLVGPRPRPGVVELARSLSGSVESACSFGRW